jgi:hypothetical protein
VIATSTGRYLGSSVDASGVVVHFRVAVGEV